METKFKSTVQIEMYDDNVISNEESIDPVGLEWSVDVDMREWGIKSLDIHVPDQKIEVHYTIMDEAGDTEVDQTKVIDLSNVQVELISANIAQSITPRTLEFYQGKVTVIF